MQSDSHTFRGVRFFLFGFDPLNQSRVRSKLISGGGVDAGQYNQDCTHVIVDKVVYDDPVCLAARNDRKTLVTALWVDHSFDVEVPVEPTSIIYRPPRDLNGIPGANTLIICLTGYHRHDRDDIMNMVAMMGAQFSKPLLANKVTHLICYKFEGEKYELAVKMKKIKLVNHRWLEDCLRDWKLLPEDDYNQSGYELETLEARAKDSEEEVDDDTMKRASDENKKGSPSNFRRISSKVSDLPEPSVEPEMPQKASEPEGLPSVMNANKLVAPSKKNNANRSSGSDNVLFPEMLGPQSSVNFNNAASVELCNPKEITPISTKSGGDFGVTEPHYSDGKFSSLCFTRRTPQISPSLNSTKELGDVRSSSKVLLDKSMKVTPTKNKQGTEVSCSGYVGGSPEDKQSPCKGVSSNLRRHMDISCGSSAQKSFDAQDCDRGSPGVSNITKSESKSSEFNMPVSYSRAFPGNEDTSTDDPLGTKLAQNSCVETLIEPAKGMGKSAACNDDILNSKIGQTKDTVVKPFSGGSSLEKPGNMLSKGQDQWKQLHVEQLPSCEMPSEIDRSKIVGASDVLPLKSGNSTMNSVRKKTVAKKTLGSRPKVKTNTNKKGSIIPNDASTDPAMTSKKELHDSKMVFASNRTNEVLASDITFNTMEVEQVEMRNNEDKADVDRETEAPEDKHEDQNVLIQQKDEVNEYSDRADKQMEMKSEESKHVANISGNRMHEDNIATGPGNGDQSTMRAEAMTSKIVEGTKRQPGKGKAKAISASTKVLKPKEPQHSELTYSDKKVQNNATDRRKGASSVIGQTKNKNTSTSQRSMELKKENVPVTNNHVSESNSEEHVGKNSIKLDTEKSSGKSRKINSDSAPGREALNQVKADPMWFILSGHRLQRKEFQQLIKRLKGKCCRDSHQWSYQATHFIAPDPIRRTEKFFAAAASGRWILKTDYLSACSQSGRFLPEEPYEWHKNGLSEDGAINLEAPRKWRLLRERTGHGAFYGMQIIIYGECITPPLDTLKRVVKAGDGTILATSPPYARFLNSGGVDYAIVSPGMPRVDIWVQEFLKHEIPCVLTDYLVDYICKPGYSLDKHVLYNTQAWAQESYNKLLKKTEEIIEVKTPFVERSVNDDIACQVCSSTDRGDVMLICGDENGTAGCGIGMHIDCCDPPLEKVPEEDWFCMKCREGEKTSDGSKKRKKR